jgi:cytochrome c oxidase subunit 2
MLLAVSEITREVDRAMWLIGGTSLLLLAGITAAMIWIVVKYRRGNTPRTSQIGGNMWVETVWVVLPTLLVLWMFFVGYKGFTMMRNPPQDAMVVEVTAKQWLWAFRYPEEKLETSEMVVPVNQRSWRPARWSCR